MDPGNISTNITTSTDIQITDPGDNTVFTALLYTFTIIAIVGITGNLLTFVTILTKVLERGTYVLLLALSAFDFIYVLFSALYFLTFNFSGGRISLAAQTGCHWFPIIQLVSGLLSSWILIIVTVERFSLVFFPIKARGLLTKKRTILVLLLLLAVLLSFHWQFFGGSKPVYNTTLLLYPVVCPGKNPSIDFYNKHVYIWILEVLYSIIPVALLSSLNIAIIVKYHYTVAIHPYDSKITNSDKGAVKRIEESQQKNPGGAFANTVSTSSESAETGKESRNKGAIKWKIQSTSTTSGSDVTAYGNTGAIQIGVTNSHGNERYELEGQSSMSKKSAQVGIQLVNKRPLNLELATISSDPPSPRPPVRAPMPHGNELLTMTSNQKSARRLTKICLTLSTTYVLLMMPYTVFLICKVSLSEEQQQTYAVALELSEYITWMIGFLNHCVSVGLYCLTSKEFRKSLKNVLCHACR